MSKKTMQKYYDFSKHEAQHYGNFEETYGAILVAKSYDKVLLISANDSWEFPKGHRNDGENEIGAAIREVKEETDITIDSGDFILNDKGDLLTYKIEYPWKYGEDILIYHISRILEKQKSCPSERPYWNRVGPRKKRITLYLVPVEMDRFKLKVEGASDTPSKNPDDPGVALPDPNALLPKIEWVSWEEAFKRMASNSIHIEALVTAFNDLQQMKKIPKNQQLPNLTPKIKKDIRAKLAKEANMMAQPIKKWQKQPKNWEAILNDMKGVSRTMSKTKEKEDPKETSHDKKTKEKEVRLSKETKKHNSTQPGDDPKDDTIDDENDAEESLEEVGSKAPKDAIKGGDANDQSNIISFEILGILLGLIVIGFVLLLFWLVRKFALHSTNEPIEERVWFPMA